MSRPSVVGIAPFFIAKDVAASMSFYQNFLGFEVAFSEPGGNPFFGIVSRDGAMLMLKSVGAAPIPNHTRDPSARWDAYVSVPDPDTLAAEYLSRGVQFSEPLKDTHDGLRGFELKDPDGYVLFFGCPSPSRLRRGA